MELFLALQAVLLFCVTLQVHASASETNDLRLELASVVFRHGDRSPIHGFPTDRYTESDWPQGYGQLSIVGMQQQYHLGNLLQERYVGGETCSGLVCANYTRVQLRVRSTDVDRTLMSVESQLSAFFPPGTDQMFNPNLTWQPIPIHTIPTTQDTLLRSLDVCPYYNQLREKDMESAEYKKMEAEYQHFFEDLTNNTGMTVNLSNVWQLEDTLFIENVSPGYELPSWVTVEYLAKLTILANFGMTLMFNSTVKNRLSAGNWLNKVVTDMKGKRDSAGNKTLEDMNLFLYSAHDTTVAAMLSALGLYDNTQPGYASAFLIELYSSGNGYYVKMFRRYGPDSDEFQPLNATFCSQPSLCTLDEFEKFVKPLVPVDLEEECKINGSMPHPTPSSSHPTPTSPSSMMPHPTTTPTPAPTLQELQKQNRELKTSLIVIGAAFGVLLLITIILSVALVTVCRKRSSSSQERLFSALHEDS